MKFNLFAILSLLGTSTLAAPAPAKKCHTTVNYKAGQLHARPKNLQNFCSGAFAIFQADGNFVVYPPPGGAAGSGFQSNTANGCGDSGKNCMMSFTKDGSLVIDTEGYEAFNTETPGGALLTIAQSSPFVIIQDVNGTVLYNSG